MNSSSEYWCPYHLIVTVEGPEGARSVTTAKPFARVGTDEAADVVLPHSQLPRRALYLHATKEGVFWVNLAEANDTEGPLRGWLGAGKAIPFGDYRISARLSGNGHDAMLAPPDLCAKGTIPEPLPALTIAFDDQQVASRKLSRRLTLVGRRRPSALRIGSQDLSASHLVLYWEAGKIWAVDLLSRTGTMLDGETIEATPFPAGSSLTAGEVKLKHEEQSADASFSLSDLTVPLDLPGATEEPSLAVPSSEIWNVRGEKTPEGSSAMLAVGGSSTVYGHLLLDREKSRLEREQWLRERAAREVEWNRRLEELEAREAAVLARQQARETALERQASQLAQRQAELDSTRARLDVERRGLEQQRAALSAERKAAETPPRQEPSRRERQPPVPPGGRASGKQPMPRSTRASKRPPTTPAVPSGIAPASRHSSEGDPDSRHDAVVDRLFQVSRHRRSWWSRLWSAFSWRSSRELPPEPTETADSDHGGEERE